MVKLSIIMPCYKGESFIENSIRTVENVVSKFCDDFEIIIVVDDLSDNTYYISKNLEKEFPNLKVVLLEKRIGKGYAIKNGIKFAKGEYIALFDADLDYLPEVLEWFLDRIKNADIVIGNRRDKKSKVVCPALRKFLSYCFNVYVNLLFPELKLKDTQAGIKLLKKEVAEDILTNILDSYAFDVSLLVFARRRRYKIVTSPCIFIQKHSNINSPLRVIKTIMKMAVDVFKLRMKV